MKRFFFKKQIVPVHAFLTTCVAFVVTSCSSSDQGTEIEKKNMDGNKNACNEIRITQAILLDTQSNYSLMVRTKYLYDSMSLISWGFERNRTVIEQELIFGHIDSIVSSEVFKTEKRNIEYGHQVTEVSNNVVTNIGLVRGTKGVVYKVEAFGGCNACPESASYYSVQGEELMTKYSSKMDDTEYENVDYHSLINQYGVVDTKKVSPEIDGVIVFPPQDAGKPIKLRLR